MIILYSWHMQNKGQVVEIGQTEFFFQITGTFFSLLAKYILGKSAFGAIYKLHDWAHVPLFTCTPIKLVRDWILICTQVSPNCFLLQTRGSRVQLLINWYQSQVDIFFCDSKFYIKTRARVGTVALLLPNLTCVTPSMFSGSWLSWAPPQSTVILLALQRH